MKKTFEERHADNISRLKLILIVVCLVAIPVTFWLNHRDVGSVNSRITRIESPCLRFGPKSRLCKEAFEQAVLTITHAQACAIIRKAGLQIMNCVDAELKQEQRRDKDREKIAAEESASAGSQPASDKNARQKPRPSDTGGKRAKPDNGGGNQSPGKTTGPDEPTPTSPSPASPAPGEVPAENPAEEEPVAKTSKPGLLDPAFGIVCETTKALNLCTKGTE